MNSFFRIWILVLIAGHLSCRTNDSNQKPATLSPNLDLVTAQEETEKTQAEKEAVIIEMRDEVEIIAKRMTTFAEEVENQPNASPEEKQIASIARDAGSQDSNDVTRFILTDTIDEIETVRVQTDNELSGWKAEVKDGEIELLKKDELPADIDESEEKEQNKKKSNTYQRAGIYMVVMGALGLFTIIPTTLYTGLAVLDPSPNSPKVNLGFIQALQEGYEPRSGRYLDRVKRIGLGKAGVAVIASFITTLGISISLLAIGSKVLKKDDPSDALARTGGAILIGSGLISSALSLKIAHNVWISSSTMRGKIRNLGIFSMIPLGFGISSIAVGSSTMLGLTNSATETPTSKLFKDITPHIERLYQLRQHVITSN